MTPQYPDPMIPGPALEPEAAADTRRSRGKIARLPKALRDQINQLLADGKTYPEIIAELANSQPPLPYPISPQNLSCWNDTGYQTWLDEQRWLEGIRARQELTSDLASGFDPADLHQAALQLGTLHIFEALRSLGPANFQHKLDGDAASFARLINALARATRESLTLQKYRQACARARELLRELQDPNRKFNDSEHRAVVLKINEILGLRSEPPDPPSPPSPSRPEVLNPEVVNPPISATAISNSGIAHSRISHSEISNP